MADNINILDYSLDEFVNKGLTIGDVNTSYLETKRSHNIVGNVDNWNTAAYKFPHAANSYTADYPFTPVLQRKLNKKFLIDSSKTYALGVQPYTTFDFRQFYPNSTAIPPYPTDATESNPVVLMNNRPSDQDTLYVRISLRYSTYGSGYMYLENWKVSMAKLDESETSTNTYCAKMSPTFFDNNDPAVEHHEFRFNLADISGNEFASITTIYGTGLIQGVRISAMYDSSGTAIIPGYTHFVALMYSDTGDVQTGSDAGLPLISEAHTDVVSAYAASRNYYAVIANSSAGGDFVTHEEMATFMSNKFVSR